MTGRRFQDIWKDQYEAARGVRGHHGVVSALEYLIGEKLMTYAETAVGRPEFARELPRFVAEIGSIFSAEETSSIWSGWLRKKKRRRPILRTTSLSSRRGSKARHGERDWRG